MRRTAGRTLGPEELLGVTVVLARRPALRDRGPEDEPKCGVALEFGFDVLKRGCDEVKAWRLDEKLGSSHE